MATVYIEFSGKQGSGKTILSRTIRNHLGNLGFKVKYIADTVEGDSLKVETTKKLLGRASKILPK